MRTRGYALVLAMIAIGTMFSAIAFFSSQLRSRFNLDRDTTEHEAAVRRADVVLEEARSAFGFRDFRQSGVISINGCNVASSPRESGAQLEVLMPLRTFRRGHVQRAVRVIWDLEIDSSRELRWRRVSWRVQSEAIP
jgi:hypothetical protein